MESTVSSKNPLKRMGLNPSYTFMIVCIIFAISARVYGSYVEQQKAMQDVPQLALNSFIGDLRSFHMSKGMFPANLSELEQAVWMPRRLGRKNKANENMSSSQPLPSVLVNGDRMYLKNNYAYIYTRDKNNQVCTLWAIPVGARAEDSQTYFVIITLKTIDKWKGAALSSRQYQDIPKDAIPNEAQMLRLGMSKQLPEQLTGQEKKSFWQRLF